MDATQTKQAAQSTDETFATAWGANDETTREQYEHLQTVETATIAEAEELCRDYGVSCVLSDAAGFTRGVIDRRGVWSAR